MPVLGFHFQTAKLCQGSLSGGNDASVPKWELLPLAGYGTMRGVYCKEGALGTEQPPSRLRTVCLIHGYIRVPLLSLNTVGAGFEADYIRVCV